MNQSANDKRFVCLSDITGIKRLSDPVLYNPLLSRNCNRELLKKRTKDYLWLDLTNRELNELTLYDSNHLYKFIYRLRSIYLKRGKNN